MATPLDNNATERGLRGLVVGRKSPYGSRVHGGTMPPLRSKSRETP